MVSLLQPCFGIVMMKALSLLTSVLFCGCFAFEPAPSVLEIERELTLQIAALSVLSSNLAARTFEDDATWGAVPAATVLAHTNLLRASSFYRWPDGGSRGRDVYSIVSPETLIAVSPVGTSDHGSTARALMIRCQGESMWVPAMRYERIVTTNAQGFAFGFELLLRRNNRPGESAASPGAYSSKSEGHLPGNDQE